MRRPAIITRVPGKELRNPFKSEADAFRILVMIVVAAAIVIGVAVLISSTVGAVLAVGAVGLGLWRAGGWLGRMLESPDEDEAPYGGPDDRA